MRDLQVWIAENLNRRLSVPLLAARVCMSERNFQRVFTRESGLAPSRYFLQMRVEAARRQLELTDRSLKEIATAARFGQIDLMRRAFVRVLGISPRGAHKTIAIVPEAGVGE
jgi:transcriptional regulator GlxA family with amidase domain